MLNIYDAIIGIAKKDLRAGEIITITITGKDVSCDKIELNELGKKLFLPKEETDE